MLMSYVLDAGRAGHGMDDAGASAISATRPSTSTSVTGTGQSASDASTASPIDKATDYAAEDADVTLRLWHVLKPRLAAEKHDHRLRDAGAAAGAGAGPHGAARHLDRPADAGAAVRRVRADARRALEDEIHELAGEPFNLGSPKQLGDILFGKMGLPGGTKTKTGAWSTGARVLEELAEQGHELPQKILDWRQLSKLRSTYTDALPDLRQSDDAARAHHLRAGRDDHRAAVLVRAEPAEHPDPHRGRPQDPHAPSSRRRATSWSRPTTRRSSCGCSPISPTSRRLRQAFQDGIDIHAMTASEMFGVPVKDMPADVRRRAKAINFGIIYGISAFGLANQLGIAREEAGAYIKKYFERFPGIRDYMDETQGVLPRERLRHDPVRPQMPLPGDHAPRNPSLRAFNERAAINAPMQGTAADIIRRAMIRMEPALDEGEARRRRCCCRCMTN